MNLLRDIQNAAVDSDNVSIALRKAKILASRLNNDEFRQWVDCELNGYPEDLKALPTYRIVPAIAKGYFSGWAGSALKNAPIPASCLPERFRDFARKVFLRQGIGSIESLISAKGGIDGFRSEWPPDLVALVVCNLESGTSIC